MAVLWQGHYAPQVPMVLSAGGAWGAGPRASLFILTPLHPHFLSDSASSNPKTPEGGHSSQEIKSETSSNPSSPEICPSKEK